MQNNEINQAQGFDNKITCHHLYEQASKCCQQYSALTMQVRTLAQHVLLGYAVGVGLALSRVGEWPPPYIPYVLAGGGFILIAFAVVLWILNQHHSSAFRAIRNDVLVKLEEEAMGKPFGPWSAHKKEREDHNRVSWFAWHWPFITLLIIGVLSILAGVLYMIKRS